jgi:hypothetical protein
VTAARPLQSVNPVETTAGVESLAVIGAGIIQNGNILEALLSTQTLSGKLFKPSRKSSNFSFQI